MMNLLRVVGGIAGGFAGVLFWAFVFWTFNFSGLGPETRSFLGLTIVMASGFGVAVADSWIKGAK